MHKSQALEGYETQSDYIRAKLGLQELAEQDAMEDVSYEKDVLQTLFKIASTQQKILRVTERLHVVGATPAQAWSQSWAPDTASPEKVEEGDMFVIPPVSLPPGFAR